MSPEVDTLLFARWIIKNTLRKEGHKISSFEGEEITKAARALIDEYLKDRQSRLSPAQEKSHD